MDGDLESLSDREREALRLLGRGHEAKSIASALGLSVHTVNERLRAARRKLGVSSSREAARLLLAREMKTTNYSGYEKIGVSGAGSSMTHSHQPGIKRRYIYGAIGVVMLILLAFALSTIPANTGAESAKGPRPVHALMSLPSLFLASDFPADAFEEGAQGGTGFRLMVNELGRVKQCDVVRSSGSAALDRATCRVLSSRARFRAALNDEGRPIASTHTGTIEWVHEDAPRTASDKQP